MMESAERVSPAIADVVRLTTNGLIGFYDHFEITEILAFRKGSKDPVNVFSILVAEDNLTDSMGEGRFLGERLVLDGAKDWTFGVFRYSRTIGSIVDSLKLLASIGVWSPSGKTLGVRDLVAVPRQFVAPDSTVETPFNKVLKNNFWNGSHVVELADQKKTSLSFLWDNPPILGALSDCLKKVAPIQLAALADRIGNIVFQLPITILTTTFDRRRDSGDVVARLGWHPKAEARPLRINVELNHDKVVVGYGSTSISEFTTTIPMHASDGIQSIILWDDSCRLILGAMADTSFIRSIELDLGIQNPEPRVFTTKDGVSQRIQVASVQRLSVNGDDADLVESWTRRRIYREEGARLSKDRRFVQYLPSGDRTISRKRALKDLHFLLASFGQTAAWLWDPYLSAEDILETLFFCPHAGSDLRGLTAAEEPRGEKSTREESVKSDKQSRYVDAQRATFENSNSNWNGINLEYRVRNGNAGWPFHDRFLIFPSKTSGALAWSLGTSVNSCGTVHHILQKVDDGQMVMDAFLQLWNELSEPRHLVFKR